MKKLLGIGLAALALFFLLYYLILIWPVFCRKTVVCPQILP